jgi:redox-sensitive bicupin YhaK (pirin superfamily)
LGGERLELRMLYYLSMTRSAIQFSTEPGGRVLLIGGPPFPETILMCGTLVARPPKRITQARNDREEERQFGA